MSKKAAFTMVELIFVIVILGILAAVAVPKLNASRQDAQVTALKANIRTVFKDLETYYAANGTFGDDLKSAAEFSNVPIDDYGFLDIQKGKRDCLNVRVVYNSIGFGVMDTLHPVCSEALEDPAINQLLQGYAFRQTSIINKAYVPDEGASKINAIENPNTIVVRIMDEDSVEWD